MIVDFHDISKKLHILIISGLQLDSSCILVLARNVNILMGTQLNKLPTYVLRKLIYIIELKDKDSREVEMRCRDPLLESKIKHPQEQDKCALSGI